MSANRQLFENTDSQTSLNDASSGISGLGNISNELGNGVGGSGAGGAGVNDDNVPSRVSLKRAFHQFESEDEEMGLYAFIVLCLVIQGV